MTNPLDDEDLKSVMAALCVDDQSAVDEIRRIKEQGVREAVTKIREAAEIAPPVVNRAMNRAADLIDPDYFWEGCGGTCGVQHPGGDCYVR